MKIRGICLVKNEGDIIERSLRASSAWCDEIFVFDNGSEDDTWKRVQSLAAENPRITPFKSENKPFDDALRAEVFNAFRERAERGDWWCRLDADEFYVDEPRAFLEAVPTHEHVVWSEHIQFFFTEHDTGEELPEHYCADYSEPRLFRHRPGLIWTRGAWPAHLGLVHSRRIRVKHFQWRSPAQIQRRLDTRREAASRGWQHFSGSQEISWREKIQSAATLERDRGDGRYVFDREKMPRHLEPRWQRVMKRVLHGTGVWP